MAAWIEVVMRAAGTIVANARSEFDQRQLATLDVELPSSHIELLRHSNGLWLYDGYFHVFPSAAEENWTLGSWNDPSTWKFAWQDAADDYVCFGETVWGDQYAYLRADLGHGAESPVYFLDALRMRPRRLTSSFDEFGERYLVRNATNPFDSVLRGAHDLVGPIKPGYHLVFSPPLLLTGEERLDQLVLLPARDAMILNGDLWSQLADPPSGSQVKQLHVTKDAEGRERVRIEWVRM